MFGAWLIPGLGFWVNGAKRPAIILFVLIELLFIGGLCFSGVIIIPDRLNPASAETNIVAVLTLIVQFFNGGGLLISQLFPANEATHYSDLGCFWLMVSSGLNYYALLSTWDNFYSIKTTAPAADDAEEN